MLRARRRRHAVPRRNCQHAGPAAGETAASAANRRSTARRLVAGPIRQRARDLGHECRLAVRDWRRAFSGRRALPPEHCRDSYPAPSRAPRGYRAARRTLPGPLCRQVSQAAHRLRCGGNRGDDGAPMARQRSRVGAQHRAGGPDGGSVGDADLGPPPRSHPAAGRRSARAAVARGRRAGVHREGSGTPRR